MTAVQKFKDLFWRWLDGVAEIAIAVVRRFASSRVVRLTEHETGQFMVASTRRSATAMSGQLNVKDGKVIGRPPADIEAAIRGGSVDVVMRPDRFVFKPLELPSRAAEFLDGIVRAQIDRLTPWSADSAAFGCTRPADADTGRIVVTVAATAKAAIVPYVRALAALGARSVTVSTTLPGASANSPAIDVLQENVAAVLNIRRMRQILLIALACFVILTAAAIAAAAIIKADLQSRQDELARSILERRSAALAARNAPDDPATAAERALARRKNETPSSVIVLEVLSQILPDHTHVTELRIEGDKLRLTGITRDAPSLIRLIEQSRHFNRATFFAPTTRAPSDPGDRFNIEVRLEPVFSPHS